MRDIYKKILYAVFFFAVALGSYFYFYVKAIPEPADPARNSVALVMEKEKSAYLKDEKPFSDLLKTLDSKQVAVLAITRDGEILVKTRTNQRFYVHSPLPTALLTDALTKARSSDVTVITLRATAVPQPGPSFGSTVMSAAKDALPLVLLVVLLMAMRGSSGMFGGAKAYSIVTDPGVRFKDVIGAEDAKEALGDVVAYLKDPKRFADIGARAPKGVLMEGPPGTGKTLLAKAVAGECGVTFISLNGASFTAPFVGLGVMRVKALFKEAAKRAPCVIFIDELDGVGNREGNGHGGAAETENSRIINTILTELDGFDARSGVVVIGATNYSARVDAAMTREGRFDRRCTLGLPNIAERQALFKLYAEALKLADDVDWSQLARRSAGLAPAAIAAVVNASAITAAKNERQIVSHSDLFSALERQQMGAPTTSMQRAMSDELRRRVAIHEAGHALVGWKTGMGTLDGVTIVPRSRALGVTLLTQEEDTMLHTHSDLRARMATYLAGRGAELLVLGEASTGAANDLERASQIALMMVAETGLAGEFGPFSFKALGREAEALTLNKTLPCAVRLLQEMEVYTMGMLRHDKSALMALADALMEQETLTGDEALAILSANSCEASAPE